MQTFTFPCISHISRYFPVFPAVGEVNMFPRKYKTPEKEFFFLGSKCNFTHLKGVFWWQNSNSITYFHKFGGKFVPLFLFFLNYHFVFNIIIIIIPLDWKAVRDNIFLSLACKAVQLGIFLLEPVVSHLQYKMEPHRVRNNEKKKYDNETLQ